MKLLDAIQNVDRSPSNTQEADADIFIETLELGTPTFQPDLFGKRVTKHWLYNWWCTDTPVGFAVYYMDGIPVAVSYQRARKSDEVLQFIIEETAKMVKNFILSLYDVTPKLDLVNLDEEIDPYYHLGVSSQLLTNTGVYNGQVVTVAKRYKSTADIDKWMKVDVQLNDGSIKTINMSELHLPLKLSIASAQSK